MFAWGSTIHGQLGLGGIEEEHIFSPRPIEWFGAELVTEVACGEAHTLLLTKDGKVFSCGNNDYGQLGHDQPRKRPHPVTGLDAYEITRIACGGSHSMALNQWGQIFTWGSDTYGQLGHHLGQSVQAVPKLLRALTGSHVVQIACGQRHSVALTTAGEIYAWGANSSGQLGADTVTASETSPILVKSLLGIPIALISCGGNHTFAVSKSGAVFGWGNINSNKKILMENTPVITLGKNDCGQLGINNTTNRTYPMQLKTLRNIKVRYIACGENFSTFLTLDGGVFTCGEGSHGQLGHGSSCNEILPRKVLELMGSTVTQVACGKKHTLAFVPSRGRVYAFGLGGSGQLGGRKPSNALLPQIVHGPWVSPSGSGVIKTDQDLCIIYRIYAGGNHSFASVTEKSKDIVAFDAREYIPSTQILSLSFSHLSNCLNIQADEAVDQEMLGYIEIVFKNLACFNGSFLLPHEAHYCCTSKHHGVDVELAERTFSMIGKFEKASIKELIWICITDDLMAQLVPSPPDVEALRVYLILPLYHEFNNCKHHLKLHKPFANALLKLTKNAQKVVGLWWMQTSQDYLERLVHIFKSVVIFIIRGQKIPQNSTINYDPTLAASLNVLVFLYKINHQSDGLKIPYDAFYLPELSDLVDVRVDYIMWLSDSGANRLFLCNYPFLFDASAKLQLLQTDQAIQMQSAMSAAAQNSFLSMLFTPQGGQSMNQFLMLNVTRENIIADTLRELHEVSSKDLKKPLKVKFHGEEAEDAGGVTKEFFMLLLRQILDPKYGMFKEYEETRTIWFSEDSFEEKIMYFLIGIICGLAIYNFTIIDLPFPLALYKKLLKEPVGLNDLKDLSPTIANSLKTLLDYEDDDVENIFCLNFEISRDIFGEHRVIPLKPDGQEILVTAENKAEYVDLYIDYILNKSVEVQYEAFSEGFMKVCGGRVLQLFQSHELMAVIVGNENYDWHALEEVAEYKNGYKSSDVTIRWFWEVIHEMSLAEKKKFLLFLTGSDRIPIQGMKAIKIVIQPTNDDKYLPVAHTCFNLLDLPRYKTKEKLRYKLLQAIQQTHGFSLV